MADIRISQLPLATGGTAPAPADVVALDGTTTRKAPLSSLADVIRPMASQAEAEEGVNSVNGMSPLTTAQAISAQGASLFASFAQGALASTALQPGQAATLAQGAKADSAMQPTVYDPTGIGADAFSLFNMTGSINTAQVGPEIKATSDVLITVGAGGNYATMNLAIAAASRLVLRPYKQSGLTVEIRLLSGFVMAEQVIVKRTDLSFITITSVDPEVVIDRASLTIQVDGGSLTDYPAFTAMEGGKLPQIEVLFNMNSEGAVNGQSFIYCKGVGSTAFVGIGKGCKNAAGSGIEARFQATVNAYQAVLTGCLSRAIYALHQGRVFAESANCSGCKGDFGVYALMGGEIMIRNANVSGKTGGPAIFANRGGKIIATKANANTCSGLASNNGAVTASDGGEVVFDAGTATGAVGGNGVAATNGGVVDARMAICSSAAQDGFYAADGGRINAAGATANNCAQRGFYAT